MMQTICRHALRSLSQEVVRLLAALDVDGDDPCDDLFPRDNTAEQVSRGQARSHRHPHRAPGLKTNCAGTQIRRRITYFSGVIGVSGLVSFGIHKNSQG